MLTLQTLIGNWAEDVLPLVTTEGLLIKLREEVIELCNVNANFQDELADVVMVCLVLAEQKSIDLEQAIKKKHNKNLLRSFEYLGHGVYRHRQIVQE